LSIFSSNGTVEVFWTENADSTNLPSLQVVVATSTDAYVVWTDAHSTTPGQAVDDYRNTVYAGSKTVVVPNPAIAPMQPALATPIPKQRLCAIKLACIPYSLFCRIRRGYRGKLIETMAGRAFVFFVTSEKQDSIPGLEPNLTE